MTVHILNADILSKVHKKAHATFWALTKLALYVFHTNKEIKRQLNLVKCLHLTISNREEFLQKISQNT